MFLFVIARRVRFSFLIKLVLGDVYKGIFLGVCVEFSGRVYFFGDFSRVGVRKEVVFIFNEK